MLEKSQQDPKIRTAAASALIAGGALAAAKVVHDHAEDRRREKTGRYRLRSGETPRDGIGRVATAQLDLTIGLLRQAHGRADGGESLHEARKALKRLRALLRLSDGAFADRRYHRENVVLRDVGRALSGARDAQVLLDTLNTLNARYADGLQIEAWSGLRESLAATAAQPPTITSNGGGSLLEVLSDARERVTTWPLPNDGGPTSLAHGFADVYRRGRRAFRTARADPTPENLHELRKRAKDLWHGAQLLGGVGAKRMSALKRDAHRLSDLLGEDHDLTLLRDHARERQKLLTPGELELLIALTRHRQQALRKESIECAAALYEVQPKKLLPKLGLT